MANTTNYDFELCKEICEKLYNVEEFSNLSAVLKSDKKYPARSTFFKWKRENQELSDFYVNVQQDRGELFVEEIDSIWEGCRLGQYDASTANVLIQTLKWKASKYYPKMFGDKQQVEGTIQVEEIKPAVWNIIDAEK